MGTTNRAHASARCRRLRQSEEVLAQHRDVRARFDRVSKLIEGFETPYGMELISSVHWVVTQVEHSAKTDPEAAVLGVHAWSPAQASNTQSRAYPNCVGSIARTGLA